jgi:hypothetical protein
VVMMKIMKMPAVDEAASTIASLPAGSFILRREPWPSHGRGWYDLILRPTHTHSLFPWWAPPRQSDRSATWTSLVSAPELINAVDRRALAARQEKNHLGRLSEIKKEPSNG